LGPQGLLPTIFEFPFSRCVSLYFFRRFDHFLTSFFTVLNLLMIIEPPDDRRPKSRSARFYQHCESNIPISTAAPTHHVTIFNTHLLYSFSQKNFFKTFLGLFRGPRGSCPLFSNSPSHATSLHQDLVKCRDYC